MILLDTVLEDLLHLFYPHQCSGCASDALEKDQILCYRCVNNLPRTGMQHIRNNMVERVFSGRLPIHAAHSEFFFSKGKLIQQLLHQIKYKGNQQLGIYLGEMLGHSLSNTERFSDINAIIPMPMLKKKEITRGYNQAVIISKGVQKITGIPIVENLITRNKITATQTKKSRSERWQNVNGTFEINDAESWQGKHVLIIDDVLTTGATLEACGNILLNIPELTLSIAVLAFAAK